MQRVFERFLAALLLAVAVAHAVPADAQTPSLLGAVSRKAHALAGTFDLALNSLASSPTTEPRLGPAHTIVFTFDATVTGGSAAVTEGVATAGTPTFSGAELTVPLSGVNNAQYVTIAVSSVSTAGGGSGGSGSIRVGFLGGDVNQSRVVSVGDVAQVNAVLAQTVAAGNFLKDVNASGTLTVADKGLTNARLTQSLPALGGPLFEQPHPWTKDVSALPASARSPAIIGALQGFGGWGNGNKLQIDFSFALLFADAATPRRTVTALPGGYCFGNAPDCDPVPLQVPLPANGNTEGNADYVCDTDVEDCHVLVVERAEKKLYELYRATSAGANFHTYAAFVWDLTKQYSDVLRGDQCTSADAAGLPIAALLPTADEVAAGTVPHALRFILPNASMKEDVYVRPATHAGNPTSFNADAPPYGVRFRLKPTFDETSFSGGAKVILQALKKYGMILSDGGQIALTFADDRLSNAKWATLGIVAQTFNNIGVDNFEVVDLGAEIPLTYDCVRAP